jgi:hypothetical protein
VHANNPGATGVDKNTLVLVALMEEDVDPDIVGNDLDSVRTWMKPKFDTWGAMQNVTMDKLASEISTDFRKALNTYRTNDKLVDIERLKITALAGDLPLLEMQGDGGYYKFVSR